jgi:hypothetical protein
MTLLANGLHRLGSCFGKRAARPPRRPRLAVEALETRELLSGTYPGFTLDSSGNLYNTTGEQPQLIDTGVWDFAVVNNQVFDLHANGAMESMNADGSGKADWDQGVQQIAETGNGWLFTLHYGGDLSCFVPGAGNSLWDQGVQQIAETGNGWLFALKPGGNVYCFVPGGSNSLWDQGVRQIVGAGDGSLFTLHYGGDLSCFVPGAGNSLWDQGVQQIAETGNGWLFALKPGGNVYCFVPDGSNSLWDQGVQQIVGADDGSLFTLKGGGNLYDFVPGAGNSLWDQGVQQIAGGDGLLYILDFGGNLDTYTPGWGLAHLASGVQSFAIAGDGRAYFLQTNGDLWHEGQGLVDRLVYSFSLSADGYTLNLDDWFQRSLNDPSLRAETRTDFTRDAAITRGDLLGLFSRAEADGQVSAAGFHDLQALVANAGTLHMPGYVQDLANKVVNGDAANAHYLGASLGNLYAGSPAWQLQDLVNKWFLGLDHPAVVLTPDQIQAGWTANGAAYTVVNGSLFGGTGPSYTDVFQGWLGDCTVMASVAEVAARANLISSMFIDNGDGTWTVRFFHSGSPVYVTVDNQLPAGGNLYDHPHSGVLWVALAEKAYAQLNESGWLGTLSPGINSYVALDNGNQTTIVTALSALSGRPASTFSTGSADLGTALAQGRLVVLATGDATGHPNIEHNHAYAVVGYDPSAGLPFTVFNPWGINGGHDGANFIWGQFTANAAALQAYFYGGGWTGEAARTGLAEEGMPVNAFEVVTTPRQPAVAQAHDGSSDRSQSLMDLTAGFAPAARAVVGADGADTTTARAPLQALSGRQLALREDCPG